MSQFEDDVIRMLRSIDDRLKRVEEATGAKKPKEFLTPPVGGSSRRLRNPGETA